MDENTGVASWSTHHIPAGTPIRYALNPTEDDACIRLLFGSVEQVELELPVSVAAPIITTLRDAVDAAGARGPADAADA
jgi:hypothetical protein